jgi:hypothetical protein
MMAAIVTDNTAQKVFEDLGVSKKDAAEMVKNLKPNETQRVMVSLNFVQFAKDLYKLKGINLLEYNSVDWTTFTKLVKDVQSGKESITCAKIKEFILYFADMAIEKMRQIVKDVYGTAQKIYASVANNVSKFITYMTSTKVVAASMAMDELNKAANAFTNVDNRIKTLYDECYWSYQNNILKHVKANRILDIEAHYIDHILATLSELSYLVEQAKLKYKQMMKKLRNKKKSLSKQKSNTERKYDDKIKRNENKGWGFGTLAFVGFCGLFLGPLMIPCGIALGIGALGVGISVKQHRNLKNDKNNEINQINEEIKRYQDIIDFWKEKNVYAQLLNLSDNLRKFEKTMLNIKKQYETKKHLEECSDDIAVWLATKNKHENDNIKLALYREALQELGVDNYETFIGLENEFIKNTFKDLTYKYRQKRGILYHVKRVIVEYSMDKQLVNDVIKPYRSRNRN